MNISSPITAIKGVGEKTKESFEKLGVYTVGDILLHFPRNYTQYPAICDINDLSLSVCNVIDRGGKSIVTTHAGFCDGGLVCVIPFNGIINENWRNGFRDRRNIQ